MGEERWLGVDRLMVWRLCWGWRLGFELLLVCMVMWVFFGYRYRVIDVILGLFKVGDGRVVMRVGLGGIEDVGEGGWDDVLKD